MPPGNYNRFGRGPRRGPYQTSQGGQRQVLTAAQIAKIEAAFEELNKKAAHWETQAKQWQSTAAESQTLAGEWQERAQELERALAESQKLADQTREHCDELQQAVDNAQDNFTDWEAKALEYETEAEQAERRVSELEETLKSAEEGHHEEAQRLQQIEADFLDSKERLERRFAIQAEAHRKELLRDLLPVLDNLDRALDHLPDQGTDAQNLRQGVELTRQSFLKMLADHDVHPLNSVGQEFDPEIHEAIGTAPDPTLPPGTVIGVEQKGYMVGDELLRPARVLVTPL